MSLVTGDVVPPMVDGAAVLGAADHGVVLCEGKAVTALGEGDSVELSSWLR